MLRKIKKVILIQHVVSLVIFFLASCYLTFPLIFNLTKLTTGHGDELVIAWIQNWVIHSITSGNIFSLFAANSFFPYHNALAFSDVLITSSIFALPFLFIFREPIVTINITLISALFFLGFSIYILSFYLTRDFFASVLSGLLVIFSPAVLDKTTHLQILWVHWIPLSLLCFLVFLNTQKSRYFILSLFFFLVQTYNSFMPGYFILFAYGIIVSFYWFSQRKRTKKLLTKKNFILLFFSFALILPLIIPYYQVSKEFNYTRDIRDSIHFALQPEDLLYSSHHSRLKDFFNSLPINQISQNDEFKPGYLGIIFTLLVIFSFGYIIRNWKKQGREIKIFVTIGITGLILSFGPMLHLGRQTIHDPFPIPLPYALFYYLLPGFQGFRNSARWEMLFILAMAVVIALVLHKLWSRYRFHKQAAFYALLMIGFIAEFNFPMYFLSVPQKEDFPLVSTWLTTTPSDTVIVELPIYNWNMWPYTQHELYREYYSTSHFRRTVNGYSGFSPPPWQDLVTETLANFPSQKTIDRLRTIGVQYVIIHTNEYDEMSNAKFQVKGELIPSGKMILEKMKEYPDITLIKQFDNTFVYEL